MALSKPVTLEAFNRQESATFLRVRLGPAYSWQKLLEHWAKSSDSDGLRGSDMRCEPSFVCQRTPMYTLQVLELFVVQALEVVSDLAPAPLAQNTFELEADTLRLPWRLRHARRCTKTTKPPTH
jgi:hypothetical protein